MEITSFTRLGSIVFLLMTAGAPAAAQGPDQEDAAAPYAVLEGPVLRSYEHAPYGLLEALSQHAGITFEATGDQASEDWLLVRGLPRDSSRNVLVLLDGMPINNAATESVELHDVPLSIVERVEVYRPPLPARWGGYHAVVSILTRAPDRDAVHVSASTGSLSTHQANAGGALVRGSVGGAVDVDVLSTEGLSGRRRTPPLENLRYEDRSYQDFAPSLRAWWQVDDRTRLTLTSIGSKGRKAFSDDEYRNRWFVDTVVGVERQIEDTGVVTAQTYGTFERFFLRLHMHPEISLQERVRVGGRAEGRFHLPASQTLRVGADGWHARTDDPRGDFDFSAWGAFVEDRFAPFDWLAVTAGLRWDGSEVDALELSPSARVVLAPWPGAAVFGSWSRTTRWPAAGELVGTSDLRGETLHGYTAGVGQRLWDERLGLSVTWFDMWLSDELDIDPDTALYYNVPETTRSQGIEAEARLAIEGGLGAFASYTYNRLRRDGASVAYGAPRHYGAAGVTYHDAENVGRLTGRYFGDKSGVYRHMGRPTTVQDALVVDLYYAREVAEGLSAFASIGNVFDVRYETFQGRPMMPRTVMVGVELMADGPSTAAPAPTNTEPTREEEP